MTAPVAAPATDVARGDAGPPGERRWQSVSAWVAVLVVTVTGIVGSNAFGLRDHLFAPATSEATTPALGRMAGTAPAGRSAAAPTSLRSQPWWQDVTTLEGTGDPMAPEFTIAKGVAQWRLQGTCQSGRIVVRAASQPRAVVDTACSGDVIGFGRGSGPVSLRVTAGGAWKLTVAQLIDTPLVEPRLPAMTGRGAKAIATGSFYNVDKSGIGRVTVYEQADGRFSVRLDDFYVSPHADLQLRFSTLAAPRTSKEYLNAKSEFMVVLDVTAGSLNYTVPAGGDPTLYKSLVVWSSPVQSVYAAASLGAIR